LVLAALFSGCRYGALRELRVANFVAKEGRLAVPSSASKSKKSYNVWLSDEGATFFRSLVIGRRADDFLLVRDDGLQWECSAQRFPMKAAIKAAGLATSVRSATVSFHTLRHTVATRMLERGISPAIVAKQLGHADTKMVEQHYGHLSDAFIGDAVRRNFGEFGVDLDNNVTAFEPKKPVNV
jgi:integrase